MNRIRCLLWDFGDTLCDEKFIWNSGPAWMEVYKTFDGYGPGAMWNLGQLDTRQFATELSKSMNRCVDSIVAHLTERCRHIEFFPQTYAFFKAKHLTQAIVTVNPDLFSEVIVPVCGFETQCDAIVTSWEERTTDKNILNRLAIDRMKLQCANSEALLIDNKRENVKRWQEAGGVGYVYTDDESFARDVSDGIDSLGNL